MVGSRAELRALAVDPAAVDALEELHRPWIDAVAVRCPGCGSSVVRGSPRSATAGSTRASCPSRRCRTSTDREAWARWFPADLVVEMAAQIRGWFYALLFMSVALEDRAPYRVVVAHDRVLGEDGREMHKSWGNAVWLDEALDRMGPDAVRYLFAAHPIADPIRFGEGAAREVTRRFLTLWNVLGLFVTYANLDRPALAPDAAAPSGAEGLEAWILSRLQTTVREVRGALDGVPAPPRPRGDRGLRAGGPVELVRAAAPAVVLEGGDVGSRRCTRTGRSTTCWCASRSSWRP